MVKKISGIACNQSNNVENKQYRNTHTPGTQSLFPLPADTQGNKADLYTATPQLSTHLNIHNTSPGPKSTVATYTLLKQFLTHATILGEENISKYFCLPNPVKF